MMRKLFDLSSLNTTLSIRYSPALIAEAAVFTALQSCREGLEKNGRDWLAVKQRGPLQHQFLKGLFLVTTAISMEISLSTVPESYSKFSRRLGQKLYTKHAKTKSVLSFLNNSRHSGCLALPHFAKHPLYHSMRLRC
jgi:hypothetical protein